MKTTSLKILSLVTVFTASVGLTALTTGCASTSTKESTGEYIDNSTITTKVKAAFVNDPVVSALDVKVDSFQGVVQLSGFVNTSAEKAQAGRVAASIKGVTDVQNNIVVK